MRHYTEKQKEAISLTSIIGIVMTLTSLLIGLYFIVIEIKAFQNNMIESFEESQTEQFTYFSEDLVSDSKKSINRVSNRIENAIEAEYGDYMDKLKDDLDNDDFSNLSNIISPYIRDKYLNDIATDGNSIFVATYDGIICDYSYESTCFEDSTVDKNTYRHWDTFVNDSWNKKSVNHAIDSIINKGSNIIIWQYNNPENENIPIKDNITFNDLKDIYLEFGADGLKSFELLVPTYITDTGDIFGQEDIVQGVRYSNYKLIVIQRINLYDQIIAKYPGMYTDNTMKDINYHYEMIMCSVYLLGIVLTIGVVAVIIHLCNIFNKRYNKD